MYKTIKQHVNLKKPTKMHKVINNRTIEDIASRTIKEIKRRTIKGDKCR